MDWPVLCLLSTALVILAVYGWRARPLSEVNRWFSLQTLTLASWILGIAGTHSAHLPEFWGRWTFASASLMPAAFLAFTRVFPETSRWPPTVVIRGVIAIGLLLAVLSATTPWIAFGFVITASGTLRRQPGFLFPIFSIYFLLCVLAILATLIAKWRHARGLARAQLRYYNLGFFILAVGAITTNLVIPTLSRRSEYSTMGPYFVLPLVALIAHAIIRHRLLDIRWMVGRGAVFILLISATSTLIIWSLTRLGIADLTHSIAVPLAILIVLLVTASLTSIPVAPRLARLIDRYLLRGRPDLDRALADASRQLSRLLKQEDIVSELHRELSSTFAPETVITSADPATPEASSSRTGGLLRAAWAIPGAAPAVRLMRNDGPATSEEEALHSAGIEVWIALGRGSQRTGVILLGPRKNGEAYLAPSLRFLEDLAEVASLALDVAYLHRRHVALETDRHRLAHLARMGHVYAGLGHEIRTPLTTISNLVSALPDRIDDPEFRDAMVRLIPAEVSRITRLAERLRQMAPGDDGRLAPVLLQSLLTDMLTMHRPTLHQRQIAAIMRCDESLPVVLGDERQLMQLFVNLLTNALEAISETGTITIEAFATPPDRDSIVTVRVIDDGAGIDPSLQSKLFQPFFTTKTSGTGLGLSICREIADFHHAQLTLYSRPDQRGAIAEIHFPKWNPETGLHIRPAEVPAHNA